MFHNISLRAFVVMSRHAIFLPNKCLLKQTAHLFPFVRKDQLEITWKSRANYFRANRHQLIVYYKTNH